MMSTHHSQSCEWGQLQSSLPISAFYFWNNFFAKVLDFPKTFSDADCESIGGQIITFLLLQH